MSEIPQSKVRDAYLALTAARPNGNTPAWVQALHAEGESLLRETELPHTRMEEWRQTNINAINERTFAPLTDAPDHGVDADSVAALRFVNGVCSESVFVNGFHVPGLGSRKDLPAKVAVTGLCNAQLGDHAETVKAHLNHHLGARNAYTALNTAFLQDGAFVHVPRNTVVETPIHLLFLATPALEDCSAAIRNLIVLEEGAQATIILSFAGNAGAAAYLSNVVDEISLGANASLTLCKLVREGAQGNHLATTEVHQHRDSRFHAHTFSMEGAVIRNQLCVNLAGEGAECKLNGLYLNDGNRLIDNALQLTHTVPRCSSRIAYKGILDGKSKSVFTGKVNVLRDAQKTDSNQISNNLMLSDTAAIDAKPQLEIYADDVKCTHGATVGSSPPEIIFYFRSRGIDEATARGMLTYGFAGEIVDEMNIDAVHAPLSAYIYDKYSPKI
ncbi:MAG: Fe-S cluster assembly protein SufD [Candidatus Hydrogenedentes bacterium]|nr:Fe-S cluster assembly protein SufD [Candidatus Hydrogenedentota bacterium]